MSKNKEFLFKLVLTAIFSALCFALTFVSIPLPTGAKVHLGNFACVLAGMLCGGLVGGISGSLGMGLNDIASGYGWSTITRTFLAKFLLGYVVGLLFKILVKKEKAAKITLYATCGVFLVFAIASIAQYAASSPLYAFIKDGKEKHTMTFDPSYTLIGGLKAFNYTIFNTTKMVEISILVPIFTSILALILVGSVAYLLITKKKNIQYSRIQSAVVTVTAISVIVNLIAEFFGRWLLYGIEVNSSEIAFAVSVTKIPANVVTGVVTIVAVAIVYFPLYYALKHAGYSKYIINAEIDEKQEVPATDATNEEN